MDDPRRATLEAHPLPDTVEVVLVDLATSTPGEISDGLLFVVASWSGPAKAAFRRLAAELTRVHWHGQLHVGDTDDIRDPLAFATQFGLAPGGRGETVMIRGGQARAGEFGGHPRVLEDDAQGFDVNGLEQRSRLSLKSDTPERRELRRRYRQALARDDATTALSLRAQLDEIESEP